MQRVPRNKTIVSTYNITLLSKGLGRKTLTTCEPETEDGALHPPKRQKTEMAQKKNAPPKTKATTLNKTSLRNRDNKKVKVSKASKAKVSAESTGGTRHRKMSRTGRPNVLKLRPSLNWASQSIEPLDFSLTQSPFSSSQSPESVYFPMEFSKALIGDYVIDDDEADLEKTRTRGDAAKNTRRTTRAKADASRSHNAMEKSPRTTNADVSTPVYTTLPSATPGESPLSPIPHRKTPKAHLVLPTTTDIPHPEWN